MDVIEPLIIHGATLAGCAAAARLAKAGHAVELVDAGPVGGHWASTTTDVGVVDDLPPAVRLPAAWRDLFKKSGRALDAELTRSHLDLVEAPPTTHRFADGFELTLPTERGRQWHTIADTFSSQQADRWLAVLDELDTLWQYLRFHGVERPYHPLDEPPAGPARGLRRLLPRHDPVLSLVETRARSSLRELADRAGEPHLAQVILDQAHFAGTDQVDTAPAILGTRLAVERVFGRWHLADATGALPASMLVTLLSDRLELRGVLRVAEPTATPILTTRVTADASPALAPTITHALIDAPPVDGITETVDHTDSGPTITWTRTTAQGTLATTHDFTHTHPDATWGLAPSSSEAWRTRPLLRPDPLSPRWHASAASHAGNEPWAEILSAALAVYEIHEHLTGSDIRPTNRGR
ncbi:MAG TPA: NAD(P)-binding protein [Propionibacteriaceae bacterium]|nr:NAD(P)-binding protein [Propionibacteriaceae bacterium]